MNNLLKLTSVIAFAVVAGIASASDIRCKTSDSCEVYCNNGTYIGTMYWNGSKWSDGIRADADKNVVARQMVAAWGSDCQ